MLTDYDIVWSGDVVLRFADEGLMGKEEGRVAQSRGGLMSSSLTHTVSGQSTSLPRFARGSYPLFSFRPQHNGGMVLSAQSNTLCVSVRVSVCGRVTTLEC